MSEGAPRPGQDHYVAQVRTNIGVADGHRLLTLICPEVAQTAVPGQFLQIRVSVSGQDPLLRRPICVAAAREDEVDIVVRVAGRGTDLLARETPGAFVDLLGPLGRGFTRPGRHEPVALVGGGVGVAPLHFLLTSLADPSRVRVLLGARTRALLPRLPGLSGLEGLRIATDDGSEGHHGTAADLLAGVLETDPPHRVYACGPQPMLAAVARLCIQRRIVCEVSLEERMACGIGVCMGCAVPMAGGGYTRACREGPVYDARAVKWE